MIRIYNTMTRQKEDFQPLKEGEVKMYACGITPYDEIHVGHARQAVVYDVIKAYLEYAGYKVEYVRNYTDVDDKIIKKAVAQGKSAAEISGYYMAENSKDLEALGVRKATYEPKVTECIAEIIAFIQGLIDKGYGYVREGEVFYDIDRFPQYGKLSNRKREDLINSEESPNKKNPNDFVLWKPCKPGEPSWESPWGPGRPGWHIECSAMALKYLGESIDIHGGGLDLIFPHHENEIAQSEALTGKPFAHYWVHNGLVMVDGTKMSKSLGNFTTVKDALQDNFPEELRYVILTHAFGSSVDFTKELFLSARKRVYYFYQTLARVEALLGDGKASASAAPIPLVAGMEERFAAHMDDNFNTPKVIADLGDVLKEVNKAIDSNTLSAEEKAVSLGVFKEKFARIAGILCLFNEAPETYLAMVREKILAERGVSAASIEEKIARRSAAKAEKDWAGADAIKGELLAQGITLQDNPDGVSWDIAFD